MGQEPRNRAGDTSPEQLERRLLVLAPTRKDATLTRAILDEAGIDCAICADLEAVTRELERGAGALLLAEEAVASACEALAGVVARQPPWADLPILVLARGDSPSATEAVRRLGNVMLLERPVRLAVLANAVRGALRARDRQYRSRAYLLERDRTARALEEADRRKDEFLATLAHELRNPLAPIRNSLHILRVTAAPESPSDLYAIMERQVDYLARLVDDLLEVSRITRGKIELRRKRAELAAIIHAAVETSQPLLEGARHELTIALAPGLWVEADTVRLVQVFANILNNAVKYTEPGGHIWVTAAREDCIAVVSVRDTGIGIEAADLPRVFDVFMQGDSGRSRGGGGLGLGLSLARTLVELHAGTIDARSEGPGKGSEFVVRLPLAADTDISLAEPPGTSPETVHGPVRVLVIDDSRDAANSLRVLLELLGMEVRVAYDGPAALAACDASSPEVVLLDISMPGMDGYAVARGMRERAGSRDMTLIALTGWGQDGDRRSSKAAGFDHHLIKPVDVDALQALLRSVRSAQD